MGVWVLVALDWLIWPNKMLRISSIGFLYISQLKYLVTIFSHCLCQCYRTVLHCLSQLEHQYSRQHLPFLHISSLQSSASFSPLGKNTKISFFMLRGTEGPGRLQTRATSHVCEPFSQKDIGQVARAHDQLEAKLPDCQMPYGTRFGIWVIFPVWLLAAPPEYLPGRLSHWVLASAEFTFWEASQFLPESKLNFVYFSSFVLELIVYFSSLSFHVRLLQEWLVHQQVR